MPVTTFNHGRAKELGLDVNSRSSFPEDCYICTYVGCVLDKYERNGRDDSDFYAIVWDEESQAVKDICYASTRGWTYNNGAVVDATPLTKAKAAHYWYMRHRKTIENSMRIKLAKPHVGCEVIVKRGRKVPRGFTGAVRLIEKRVNRYAPQPMYKGYGAWDTCEDWALVEGTTAAWTVKVDHLDVIPNPQAVEEAVRRELAQYDANCARLGDEISWQSQPYQDLHFAGINLADYA